MKSVMDPVLNGLFIKISIGNGHKQVHYHHAVFSITDIRAFLTQSGCYLTIPLCHIHQKILSCRNLGIFATDAGDRTTGTIGSFLTLVTEHFIFHGSGLLCINKFL